MDEYWRQMTTMPNWFHDQQEYQAFADWRKAKEAGQTGSSSAPKGNGQPSRGADHIGNLAPRKAPQAGSEKRRERAKVPVQPAGRVDAGLEKKAIVAAQNDTRTIPPRGKVDAWLEKNPPIVGPRNEEKPLEPGVKLSFEKALEAWENDGSRSEKRSKATYAMTTAKEYEKKSLSLDKLALKSVPPQLGVLKSVRELNLNHNKIETLPSDIGRLNLTKLSLRHNEIGQLPLEIGSLVTLKELDLTSNRLANLPSEIAGLKSLTKLKLDSNEFETLPDQLGELKQLRKLSASHNGMKSVPDSLGMLRQLEELNLSDNMLQELPEEWSRRSEEPELPGLFELLRKVDLSKNALTGLPPSIRRPLQKLEIDLSNNPISYNQFGTLPREYGGFSYKTTASIVISDHKITNDDGTVTVNTEGTGIRQGLVNEGRLLPGRGIIRTAVPDNFDLEPSEEGEPPEEEGPWDAVFPKPPEVQFVQGFATGPSVPANNAVSGGLDLRLLEALHYQISLLPPGSRRLMEEKFRSAGPELLKAAIMNLQNRVGVGMYPGSGHAGTGAWQGQYPTQTPPVQPEPAAAPSSSANDRRPPSRQRSTAPASSSQQTSAANPTPAPGGATGVQPGSTSSAQVPDPGTTRATHEASSEALRSLAEQRNGVIGRMKATAAHVSYVAGEGLLPTAAAGWAKQGLKTMMDPSTWVGASEQATQPATGDGQQGTAAATMLPRVESQTSSSTHRIFSDLPPWVTPPEPAETQARDTGLTARMRGALGMAKGYFSK